MTLHAPSISYLALTPFILLMGAALVLLVVTALSHRRPSPALTTAIGLATALGVLVYTVVGWIHVDQHGPLVTAAGAIVMDRFGLALGAGVAVSLMMALTNAHDWQVREGIVGGEYQMLTILAAAGSFLMTQANDLVVVFVGLETLSIALYCLIAFNRRRPKSAEAAMKYFLLGSFAAAIFIYGVALTYGATGSTNLTAIAYFLGTNHLLHPGLLLAGGSLMLIIFCLKGSAAPFHFWVPDVYEGAPTPLTGMHSSLVWAGSFGALVRIVTSALGSETSTWRPIFFALAVMTVATGALFSVLQTNAKRLLAYSAVTQSGFVLLGIWAATPAGVSAVVFYVVTYGPIVLSTFSIVGVVAGAGDSAHALSEYRGLVRRSPWVAVSLTILLLSQLGLPFTTGFDAKFAVLAATVDAGNTLGAVVAMTFAVVAAYAYLRWITSLFAADDGPTTTPLVVPWGSRVVIVFGVLYTVVVGIDPGLLSVFTSHATLLFQP